MSNDVASITAGGLTAPRRALVWAPPLVRFVRRKPLGFVALLLLTAIGLAAVFAPLLAPYSYAATDFSARLQGPSAKHLFGTDNVGRDLLSRVMYGARVSLGISFAAVILAKSLATVVASVSGYYGGVADLIIQRFVDLFEALPRLVLLITLVGLLGSSPLTMVLLVGMTNVPSSTRLVRSVVVSVRAEPYIEAARAIGAADVRILVRHILPNILHIVIFSATVTLGAVILAVASLGFLGYGVPPPTPDLGAMLSGSGMSYMRTDPWMAIWPGLIITLTVFSFNILGDALRDVLDPRLRGSG